MKLNSYIDHTLLKNSAVETDFGQLLTEAKDHSFYSVCVPPCWVTVLKKAMVPTSSNTVKMCSVSGFSFGYSTLTSKLNEISELFTLGCDEVDVVLNHSALKSSNWNLVENELQEFHNISKSKSLKIIVESGMLNQKELLKLLDLFNKYPSTFIKTSTGFMNKGASIDDVTLMRKHLDSKIKIKASGGIKTKEDALRFIKAGADRLGTSQSISIVKGDKDESSSTY